MRISFSYGKGKRSRLLQEAAVRIFYADILQLRPGKALDTPPGSYTDILYGYPPATRRESARHSSGEQL